MSPQARKAADIRFHASVDDAGLLLPWACGTVDVLFDGQRVWSVPGPGVGASGGGPVGVHWPGPLRRFLDGVARVTLREHVSGRVLFDDECRFGSSGDRIRVVDAAGRPLAVDKIGHLDRPFGSSEPAAVASLLDQVAEILAILRDECALPAFLAFGALLGAVREGRLLGHDNDIDLSYLSGHEHPLDVARESYRIQRVMKRHGFGIRRFSTADFKVTFPICDGSVCAVDIFGGFMCEDLLHVMPRLRVPLRRHDIVPLSKVHLEGRAFPAPADPATFLAAAYGPDWRVPDPAWRPQPNPLTRRRFDGWTRGLRTHRDPWEHYNGSGGDPATQDPSAFARWVLERERQPTHIVDVGSGPGRDALWFARSGHRVTALDYTYAAVERGGKAATRHGLPATFEFFNLYELRQVLAVGARLARGAGPPVMYGRLVPNTLADRGRDALWRLASMALRGGGRLYLEFWTDAGNGPARRPGKPFLRPLDLAVTRQEIEAHGGTVEHQEPGNELEPFLARRSGTCRLVVRW